MTVIEFESDFTGTASNTIKMVYSGLVAVNRGNNTRITGCQNLADIVINTQGNTQINCVAGIATYNVATIEYCQSGSASVINTLKVVGDGGSVSTHIAAIANINHGQGASIRNCENYSNVTVEATQADGWNVALAGIFDYQTGNQQDNINHNYTETTASALGVGNLRQGEIYIA